MPRVALTLLLLTLLTLPACAPKQRSASGFLDDYTRLRPDPDIKHMRIYRAPGFDLAQYDTFIIDPVQVRFAPDAQGEKTDPAKLDELTTYFHDQLSAALAKRYAVIDPGPAEAVEPGTLRLRLAITDIDKAEPVLNVHPATKLSGVGLGGASAEGEARDAVTDQQLLAFLHTRPGNRLAIAEGLTPYAHARQAMDFWVERIVLWVDTAHGIEPGKGDER